MNRRIAGLACAVCVGLWVSGHAFARAVDAEAKHAAAAGEAREVEVDALVARIAALDAWRWVFRDATAVGLHSMATSSTPNLIGAGPDENNIGDALASGIESFAAGMGAYAFGHRSTAVGTVSETDGEFATAIGYGAWARHDPATPFDQTHQTAVGAYAMAFGDRVVALGGRAIAFAGWDPDRNESGTSLVAVGTDALASGRHNTAVGDRAQAMNFDGMSSAFGSRAWANAHAATALGASAEADATGAVAVGARAWAFGEHGVSIGRSAVTSGSGAIAIGGTDGADLDGLGGVDPGEVTWAVGKGAIAIGAYATAQGEGTFALGRDAWAEGAAAFAAGRNAAALGEGAMSLGAGTQATGIDATSFGTSSAADGQGAFAFGGGAFASGAGAGAIGLDSVALGVDAMAFGARSMVLADNSVALGAGSIADVANTVSIGASGAERRMVNVADGIDDTDAANYGQVRRLAERLQVIGDAGVLAVHFDDASRKAITLDAGTALRGLAAGRIAHDSGDAVNGAQLFAAYGRLASVFGAGAAQGADFIRPAYALDNGTFDDVGSALTALQAQSRDLRHRIDAMAGTGALPPDYVDIDGANDGSDVATNNDVPGSIAIGAGARVESAATNSVAIGAGSVAARADSVSVGDAGKERQVTHVAAGTEATDAVNVAQMEQADAQVYANARNYVDLRVEQSLAAPMAAIGELRTQMDERLGAQDVRIDRHGAMTAAAMNMASSAAGVRTQNRVAIGTGTSGGEQALAFGYQRAISERAAFTLGGAFSSGENSAGVGVSFGW